MENRRSTAPPRLSARVRTLACALASALLFTSGTCHLSVHSDPDGCDPNGRPCPPTQSAHANAAPELPLEAYRILRGGFVPLPDALPWAGWSLEDVEGPPPLAGACEPTSCAAHRTFAERLGAANPSLLGPRAELLACGAADPGTSALLAIDEATPTVLLAFDATGRLVRIERR